MLLVGGASTRFGSPKALAQFDGETLAERAWRLLGEACDERIAVGKRADGLELPFDVLDDGTDVRAPIAGVVAGLRAATHDARRRDSRRHAAADGRGAARARSGVPRRRDAAERPAARARIAAPPCRRSSARSQTNASHCALRSPELDVAIVDLDAALLVNVNTPDDVQRL